jgi:carbohydrate-selective porin OprB
MVKPQFSFKMLNAGLAAAFLVSGLALLAMPAAASDAKAEAPTAGIVPIANYKGDFWEREFLFGDFGGKRTEWAEKGVQFNIDTVHWVDTIVDGGKTDDSEFGGNITYNLTVDLMRAGILPGALIQVRTPG